MVVGFGKVFALGEAFGGGGGSDSSEDGVALGVGDSRRLAFLLPAPEVLALAPKSPVSVLSGV